MIKGHEKCLDCNHSRRGKLVADGTPLGKIIVVTVKHNLNNNPP